MNMVQRVVNYGVLAIVLMPATLNAQQRGPDRPQVPPVPVEKAMERRAEQATRQLERLERQLPQAAQRAEARMQANVAAAMERRAGAQGPPDAVPLPEILDIRARSGELRYTEVQIEPFIRVIQREWVLLVNESDLKELSTNSTELLNYLQDRRELRALDKSLLTFRVPHGLDNQQSIERLLPEHLHTSLDRQHVYQLQAVQGEGEDVQRPFSSVCESKMRIGVIDTHLQSDHPGFNKAHAEKRLEEYSPMHGYTSLPTEHGTAVTGLLIGEFGDLTPLLPAAHVFQVGAFYQQQAGSQGSKVEYLLAGIDWLLNQQVEVINMSLAGPSNNLLRQAVEAAIENNVAVVAAVGNLGPHAPVQYPAAYPGVFAVTAVDQQGQVYPWAGQGEHVDFAAPGVDVPVLRANGNALQSGTSMAAPVVSAFAGCFQQDRVSHTKTYLQQLTQQSSTEHSPVTGYGVLLPGYR